MSDKPAVTLTDRVRKRVQGVLNPLGHTLHSWGVHPDMITVFGLLLVLGAALLIANGHLQGGGVLLLIALPFDAVDGAVARAMKREGQFGAVLDSTLDRYADGVIFASLSYYFAQQAAPLLLGLALAALLGSYGVSYVRARAEGIGVQPKVGWFTRMERTGVILVMLLLPPLLPWGVGILALGTNITALQRLWFVYTHLNADASTSDH